MTIVIRKCARCHGTKMMKDIGMIEKKCTVCNGLGHIEESAVTKNVFEVIAGTVDIVTPEVTPKKTIDLTKKKSK